MTQYNMLCNLYLRFLTFYLCSWICAKYVAAVSGIEWMKQVFGAKLHTKVYKLDSNCCFRELSAFLVGNLQ